ncbi:MAG: CRISPR-associated endoribonuclease Cas6 [Deltaproteobacteria bacterium]|nr:CRISPR-associated endoribonuclease Cas6 [Deltaproteobacteria bacterium]
MRFGCSIFLNSTGNIKIPKIYRKNILSLIKETLNPRGEPSELYEEYYASAAKKANKPKPFTFSAYLPIDRSEDNRGQNYFTLCGNRINFYLSSYDPIFLMFIYNGLVGLKKNYPLFAGVSEIKIANFYLEQNTFFKQDKVKFKPYSPVLIRQMSAPNKIEKTEFIFENTEELKEALFNNISFLSKAFLDKEVKKEEVEINFPQGIKKVVAISYAGEIGINNIIEIKAPPEVLKLIYDAGLGAKRSQGYGMMGVVI